MAEQDQVFDPELRAKEKEISRREDARAIAAGLVSREQIQRENNMFAGAVSIVLGKPKRAY